MYIILSTLIIVLIWEYASCFISQTTQIRLSRRFVRHLHKYGPRYHQSFIYSTQSKLDSTDLIPESQTVNPIPPESEIKALRDSFDPSTSSGTLTRSNEPASNDNDYLTFKVASVGLESPQEGIEGSFDDSKDFIAETEKESAVSPFKLLYEDIKYAVQRVDSSSIKIETAISKIRRALQDQSILSAKDGMHCVNICKLAGDINLAIEIVDYMENINISFDNRIYNNILDICWHLNDFEWFRSITSRMRSKGLAMDHISYGTLLKFLYLRGDWTESLATLDAMHEEGIAVDVLSHSYVLATLLHQNQFHEMISLFDDLERKNQSHISIYNNAISACTSIRPTFLQQNSLARFNGTIPSTALSANDLINKSMDIYRYVIHKSKYRPDSRTYCNLIATIHSSNASHDYDLVRTILFDSIPRHSPSIDSSIPLNVAINSFLRQQRYREAISLYRSIQSPSQRNIYLYTDLITSFTKAERYDEVLSLFNDLLRYNISRNAAIYGSVLMAADKLQNSHLAWSLLRVIKKENIHMLTTQMYNSVISSMSRNESFDACKDLLKEMKELGIPRSVMTYNLLIGACKYQNKWPFALKFLSDIRKDKNEGINKYVSSHSYSTNLIPTTATYSAVISVCVESKQWNLALELLDEMEELNISRNIVTYNSVIEALHAAEETIRAELVYQSALRTGIYQHWYNCPSHVISIQDYYEYTHNQREHNASTQRNPVLIMDLHQFPTAVAKAAIMHVLGEIVALTIEIQDQSSSDTSHRHGNMLYKLHDINMLEIITGRGNHVHSSGQRGVLRYELEKFLESIDITTSISYSHSDNIALQRKKRVNPGRMIISKRSIEKWLVKQIHDDKEKRQTKGAVHGNLFLQVAFSKHAKDVPSNVRNICPFSSAQLPQSADNASPDIIG